MALHMLVHSVMAGAAIFMLVDLFVDTPANFANYLSLTLAIAIGLNLLTMLTELTITHPTEEAHLTVKMITQGRYRSLFWFGAVLVGNLVPLALAVFMPDAMGLAAAAVLTLAGIYFTEKIWVEAPQRIQLS